jgi:hypothetical protein
MGAFPAFSYKEAIERIDFWVWLDDDNFGKDAYLKKDTYIKQLLQAGFEGADDTYSKGNAIVWFDYEDAMPTIEFSLIDINALVSNPLLTMREAFPAFQAEQFGAIFSLDFDLTYASSVPQAAIDDYIEDMEAAGFSYSRVDDDYQLEVGNEKQYYFVIADDDELSWSVLFYESSIQ